MAVRVAHYVSRSEPRKELVNHFGFFLEARGEACTASLPLFFGSRRVVLPVVTLERSVDDSDGDGVLTVESEMGTAFFGIV